MGDIVNRAFNLVTGDGGILKADVRVCMETYFREFFLEAAHFPGDDKATRFKSALKIIVWGGIYLESMINFRLLAILGQITRKDEYAAELWNAVERGAIHDKLAMLGRLAKRPEIGIRAVEKRVRFVAALRNRLVHYKEIPTPVDVQSAIQDLMGAEDDQPHRLLDEYFVNEPITDIESLLTEKTLGRFRSAVDHVDKWLGWITVGKKKKQFTKNVRDGKVVERPRKKP